MLPPIKNKKSRSSSMVETKKAEQQLRQTLFYDERTKQQPKTNIRNPLIESIVQDASVIVRNAKLQTNLQKLKELGLLKSYQPSIQNMQGYKKSEYVLNDYHNKSTTNGYARNYGGIFYNR
ncbi:hypothetical protein pb186bvf_014383 [Paramecium bursaria]